MIGASNEVRTRDLDLGKVALYQLSYTRNQFQPFFSLALARPRRVYHLEQLNYTRMPLLKVFYRLSGA